jgi:lipopolysaccharide/colanic/teichoic acid biosynthesis glycosyltransferase
MEALDGQLVENTTLWLRLTLLVRTVAFVLRSNG